MTGAPRAVGILGGMGPEATVEFMRRIVKATPARGDADHIRMLVDSNPQVPSRIEHLIEKRGQDPGPTLADMARRLEGDGARFLAIPCNTAHYYLDQVKRSVGIPVLDMVDLTMRHLKDAGVASIGLLASPAVTATQLFDRRGAEHGVRVLHPVAEDRAAVLAAIRAVKASGPTPAELDAYRAVVRRLAAAGAERLVIACTELSLVAVPDELTSRTLDSLDVLVEAVVRTATEAS
ncbi:MAG: aspartate/glutamate racemase family protein [Alphaproteobacteria bacterium]|nr:aspartate/glutamate racemase family protein [Alphaproteobacteria bacterium]